MWIRLNTWRQRLHYEGMSSNTIRDTDKEIATSDDTTATPVVPPHLDTPLVDSPPMLSVDPPPGLAHVDASISSSDVFSDTVRPSTRPTCFAPLVGARISPSNIASPSDVVDPRVFALIFEMQRALRRANDIAPRTPLGFLVSTQIDSGNNSIQKVREDEPTRISIFYLMVRLHAMPPSILANAQIAWRPRRGSACKAGSVVPLVTIAPANGTGFSVSRALVESGHVRMAALYIAMMRYGYDIELVLVQVGEGSPTHDCIHFEIWNLASPIVDIASLRQALSGDDDDDDDASCV
jgi:hypothetical protein